LSRRNKVSILLLGHLSRRVCEYAVTWTQYERRPGRELEHPQHSKPDNLCVPERMLENDVETHPYSCAIALDEIRMPPHTRVFRVVINVGLPACDFHVVGWHSEGIASRVADTFQENDAGVGGDQNKPSILLVVPDRYGSDQEER